MIYLLSKLWWRIRFTFYLRYLLGKFEKSMWIGSGKCFDKYNVFKYITTTPEDAVIKELATWYI